MWYYPSTGMPLLAVAFIKKRILFSQQLYQYTVVKNLFFTTDG
jgi:hypothetical protein